MTSPPPDQPASAASEAVGDAVADRLSALARFTDEPGRLTRLYLGPAHRAAADEVVRWMREAGMSALIDAAANVVGRYEGAAPDAPAFLLGSHIDSVRDAGRFDGPLGVLAAIAAVGDLARRGRRRPFAIEVVAFGDEEGIRFPTTLTGSMALAGRFDPRCLDDVDADGISHRDALIAFGCDPAGIPALARTGGRALAYLEAHIEQGPVLERRHLPLGIVSAINGVSRGAVEVTGGAGHAGTVPMDHRKDALAGAAEMVLAVEKAARSGVVATVGQLVVPEGAVNTVPGRVRFTYDVRSADDTRRRAAVAAVHENVAAIAARRGLAAAISRGHEGDAVPADARLSEVLARAVTRQGIEPLRLPSGAGHDAMAFHRVLPLAMLFVRCRGGISHNPAEFASPADIGFAVRTLIDVLETYEP
ncbi:MAG: allantoate amidohydrolase [Bauldia sp.]|nr:allantoate amidohydrolase [Bauldia sp.]